MKTAASGLKDSSTVSFWLGMAAYLVPSFPIAFVWHLVLFERRYRELGIYTADPIIPLGLASMIIQAAILSWVFPRAFLRRSDTIFKSGLLFGLIAGVLSWSFTTLAVAAKHPMSSNTDYVILECCFTFLQFLIVGPLMALAHRT